VQTPTKNSVSFLYKAMMPDYRKCKISQIRENHEALPMTEKWDCEDPREQRLQKAHIEAKEVINEIYEM